MFSYILNYQSFLSSNVRNLSILRNINEVFAIYQLVLKHRGFFFVVFGGAPALGFVVVEVVGQA